MYYNHPRLLCAISGDMMEKKEDKLIFTRRLWAEINMNAVEANYNAIRSTIGDDV